jgi:hypothetical protein
VQVRHNSWPARCPCTPHGHVRGADGQRAAPEGNRASPPAEWIVARGPCGGRPGQARRCSKDAIRIWKAECRSASGLLLMGGKVSTSSAAPSRSSTYRPTFRTSIRCGLAGVRCGITPCRAAAPPTSVNLRPGRAVSFAPGSDARSWCERSGGRRHSFDTGSHLRKSQLLALLVPSQDKCAIQQDE